MAQISTTFYGFFGWPKTSFGVSKLEFSDLKSVQFLKNVVFTPLHRSENRAITVHQLLENRLPIFSKKLTRFPVFSIDVSLKLVTISDRRHDCLQERAW